MPDRPGSAGSHFTLLLIVIYLAMSSNDWCSIVSRWTRSLWFGCAFVYDWRPSPHLKRVQVWISFLSRASAERESSLFVVYFWICSAPLNMVLHSARKCLEIRKTLTRTIHIRPTSDFPCRITPFLLLWMITISFGMGDNNGISRMQRSVWMYRILLLQLHNLISLERRTEKTVGNART